MERKNLLTYAFFTTLITLEIATIIGLSFNEINGHQGFSFVLLSIAILGTVLGACRVSVDGRRVVLAACAAAMIIALAYGMTAVFGIPLSNSLHASDIGPAFAGRLWSTYLFSIAVMLGAVVIAEPPLSDRQLGAGALIDWTFDAAVFVMLIDFILESIFIAAQYSTHLPSAWIFLGVPYQQILGSFILGCFSCGAVIAVLHRHQFTRTTYAIVSGTVSIALVALGLAAVGHDLILVFAAASLTVCFLLFQTIIRFRRIRPVN